MAAARGVQAEEVATGTWRASIFPQCCQSTFCCFVCAGVGQYDDKSLYEAPQGLDWEAWERFAVAPTVYDPPQANPELSPWWYSCWQLNWMGPRSPLCASPFIPCCCAASCFCCVPGLMYGSIAEPDEWFKRMLLTGTSRQCPKNIQGIYWMDGNYAPESIVTFHDANWISPTVALKLGKYNWSRDYTMMGSAGIAGASFQGAPLRMEVSPNGKWILFNQGGTKYPRGTEPLANTLWMYRPQPGDVFRTAAGDVLPWEEGDLMRITYSLPFDPTSKVSYQYMVRRVAYLDDEGKLVKTEASKQLSWQASKPAAHPTSCCGYGYCNLSQQQMAEAAYMDVTNPTTAFLYAPPPPDSMN